MYPEEVNSDTSRSFACILCTKTVDWGATSQPATNKPAKLSFECFPFKKKKTIGLQTCYILLVSEIKSLFSV